MLSVEDALERLSRDPVVHLLGLRRDGWPTAWPMVARVTDGAVEMSTYRASAKVRLLLARGRAAVLSLPRDPADPSVEVAGPIGLVEGAVWTVRGDGPTTSPATAPIAVPPSVVEGVADAHQSGKRVVLRVMVETARLCPKPGS